MNQEQLRRELMRFIGSSDLRTKTELFDIFIQCYFDIIVNHHEDKVYKQSEADAKMIIQMMFSKLIHLRKILEGVSFTNKEGNCLIDNIIDPTIVTSLVRNFYETVCLFNLVYIIPDSDEKKQILHNLWVISGLKFRQRFATFATTNENIEKIEEEQEKITNCIDNIKSTQLFKGLDVKNKDKILKKIKEKDFKIKIIENNVQFLTWQEISKEFIVKSDLFDQMYTYFSLYSHPSYVSVFQFGQMFRKKDSAFIELVITNVNFCIALSSVFLADYINVFSNTLTTFEKRSDIEQIMLNFYNKMLRGEEYAINETWKKIG